jgi:hypothetical protein
MRLLIALGIIAGCRGNDKDERTSAPNGSAVAQPHTTRPPISAPVAPTLDRDAASVLPQTPNASSAFDQQARDSRWAPDAERDLRQKLTNVHGRLEAVECRQSMCRVTLSGTDHELARASNDLEASLQASARSMMLGRSDRADGTVELHAFVDFDRR